MTRNEYHLGKIFIKLIISIIFIYSTIKKPITVSIGAIFGWILMTIMVYGIVSFLGFIYSHTGLIIGTIVLVVFIAIVAFGRIPDKVLLTIQILTSFGGFALDVFRVGSIIKHRSGRDSKAEESSFAKGLFGNRNKSEDISTIIMAYNDVLERFERNSSLCNTDTLPQSMLNELGMTVMMINTSKKLISKYNSGSKLSKDELKELQDQVSDTISHAQEFNRDFEYYYNSARYHQDNGRNGASGNNSSSADNKMSYFDGCDSSDSLNKRYKDLCKVYHPDMGNGSEEVFKAIQDQYNTLKKKWES